MPRAPFLRPREGRLHHAETWVSPWARGPGTQHLLRPWHTNSRGAAWLDCVPTCLHRRRGAVYLAYYPMFAYKHREFTRRRGGHQRRGEAKQERLLRLLLPPPLLQLGWHYLGTEVGATEMGGLPLQSQGETKGDVLRCCAKNPSKMREWKEKSQGKLLISSKPAGSHLHSH